MRYLDQNFETFLSLFLTQIQPIKKELSTFIIPLRSNNKSWSTFFPIKYHLIEKNALHLSTRRIYIFSVREKEKDSRRVSRLFSIINNIDLDEYSCYLPVSLSFCTLYVPKISLLPNFDSQINCYRDKQENL